MPEIIRAENERLRSRPRRGGFLASQLAILMAGSSRPAYAQDPGGLIEPWLAAAASLTGQEIAGLTLTLGLLAVAVVTAIMLVRTRARAAHAETLAHESAAVLRADMERLRAVLLSEPQILFVWSAAEQRPDVTGDAAGLVPGMTAEQLLDFDTWLEPAVGHDLREAVAGLRDEGRGFLMSLESRSGAPIEASGRIVG